MRAKLSNKCLEPFCRCHADTFGQQIARVDRAPVGQHVQSKRLHQISSGFEAQWFRKNNGLKDIERLEELQLNTL